jgi:hypothetical protein
MNQRMWRSSRLWTCGFGARALVRTAMLISSILLTSSVEAARAQQTGSVRSDAAVASEAATVQRFIIALNGNDAEAVRHNTATPFALRTQEWTTGNDSKTFSLKPPIDKVLRSDAEMSDVLQKVLREVRVSSAKPARRSAERERNWRTKYLNQAPAEWTNLSLYLLLRGIGDVEHIVIVGVDRNSKIRGLYVN